MPTESEINIKKVSKVIQGLRLVARAVTALPFKKTFSNPENRLQRMEQLAEDGYGSLILINHFSKGEFSRVIGAMFANSALGDREYLLPVALHQDRGWYHPVGRLIGVSLYQIISPDTIKFAEENPTKSKKIEEFLTREGGSSLMHAYVERGLEVLDQGGVVIMAPQGARRPYLESVTSAVGLLLGRAKDKNKDKIAITFLGVSIPGVEDYSQEGMQGYHLGEMYELNAGTTITASEMQSRADGKSRMINQITLEELTKVVPSNYLSKKSQ